MFGHKRLCFKEKTLLLNTRNKREQNIAYKRYSRMLDSTVLFGFCRSFFFSFSGVFSGVIMVQKRNHR